MKIPPDYLLKFIDILSFYFKIGGTVYHNMFERASKILMKVYFKLNIKNK